MNAYPINDRQYVPRCRRLFTVHGSTSTNLLASGYNRLLFRNSPLCLGVGKKVGHPFTSSIPLPIFVSSRPHFDAANPAKV